MKRTVLCVFSLVVYLLLFCTVFTPMAQREMTILAEVKQIKKNDKRNANVPGYAGTWDDVEELYQVVDGSGWNTGTRVQKVDPMYYNRVTTLSGKTSHMILHPGTEYTLILSASRNPQEGDLVEIVKTVEHPGEKLIVYCPEGVESITGLQNNFTIAAQGEKGILLDSRGIKMPYFEHRMKQSLSTPIVAEDMRVYSYSEAAGFLHQLPAIAQLVGWLFAGVILWGGTCLLTRKRQSPWLLGINAGTVGLTLLPIWSLTKAIDLPASLMPQDSILNIGHYLREFSNMFAAMDSVGDTSLQTLSRQMTTESLWKVLIFTSVSVALLLVEKVLCNRKAKKEKIAQTE